MDKLTSALVIYWEHHTVMKNNSFLTDTTWMNHRDNLSKKKKNAKLKRPSFKWSSRNRQN